jgi:hypothetical protein
MKEEPQITRMKHDFLRQVIPDNLRKIRVICGSFFSPFYELPFDTPEGSPRLQNRPRLAILLKRNSY